MGVKGKVGTKNLKLKTINLAIALLLLSPLPTQAQQPDWSSVPGCAQYFDHYYMDFMGVYQPTGSVWCGSDEMGWYTAIDWCRVTGICYYNYGISSE